MFVFGRFWWGSDSARTRPDWSFPTASLHVIGKFFEFFFWGVFFLDMACYVETVFETSSCDEPSVAHDAFVVPFNTTFFLPLKLEIHVSPCRSLNLGKGDVLVTDLARLVLFF